MEDVTLAKIDDIHRKMLEDTKIDRYDLATASSTLPAKCSRWLRHLHKLKFNLIKSKQRVEDIRSGLEQYYSGTLPDEQYKDKPLSHHLQNKTLTKTALENLITKDPAMIEAREQAELNQVMVDIVEFHLGILKQNSFLINKLIDLKKHEEGGI